MRSMITNEICGNFNNYTHTSSMFYKRQLENSNMKQSKKAKSLQVFLLSKFSMEYISIKKHCIFIQDELNKLKTIL